MRNQRWLPFGHIGRWTGIVFRETHLGVEGNPYVKFQRNSSTRYGAEAIPGKIQDGLQRPYLSTNPNQKLTTRPSGEHPSFEKFRRILEGDAITRFQQCKLEGICKMANSGYIYQRNGTKIEGAQLTGTS